MTESQLKTRVMRMLRWEYPEAWSYKVCDRFTSGVPDIIGCLPNGHLFAIELKVLPNRPTKLQHYVLQRIRSAGGTAGVAYSIQDVRKILGASLPGNSSHEASGSRVAPSKGGDTSCQ